MRQWSVRAANLKRKLRTNPYTLPLWKASGRRSATWSTFSRLAKSNSVTVSIRFAWLAEARDIRCGTAIPSSHLFWRTFIICGGRFNDIPILTISPLIEEMTEGWYAEASMDVETGSAASSTTRRPKAKARPRQPTGVALAPGVGSGSGDGSLQMPLGGGASANDRGSLM